MELIDTHCHIHFKDYGRPPEQVMAAAKAAGVKRLIVVGCTLADSQAAADFAAAHEGTWAAVGAHPHDGADFTRTPGASKILNKLSKMPRIVAIGEIGLDYYHQKADPADQAKALRSQIETGLSAGLPFIFHVRDAWRDFWPVFDEYDIKRAVIHSFSAGPKQLNKILERGLYVGLNGIMTFTKDESQLEAARQVPLDRLLLETDAPFLTPEPHRSQLCEPKHVRDTAEFLARLRQEPLERLAAASSANAEQLFGLKDE